MRRQNTVTITPIALVLALALGVFSPLMARAEQMLELYQRHKAMGDIEVTIARAAVRVRQKNGLTFVISAPSWNVSIFQPRKKKIAVLTYANFARNGPKHIEYFEGAIDWSLVVEAENCRYRGLQAKAYALPFKSRDGKLVDLKRGKVGSYLVNTSFAVDPHIRSFLQQMFHIQTADGIPLKYVKIGKPYSFGQGLAYNRSEEVVTILDTMSGAMKPFRKNVFLVPSGYKTTSESDLTFGDKTEDMQEIMKELD